MLAKRHLKIPVHQIAGSWKVQRLTRCSRKNAGPKQIWWILVPRIHWKILKIQASDHFRGFEPSQRPCERVNLGWAKTNCPTKVWTSGMKYYIVANTLYFIQIDCPWCYHFRKRLESRSSRPMQWLFLHATRQRSVVGIDMKIDRFRLSKARQDFEMRLRLLKILDSCYIHSTIDQPTILRLKAGRSCQGDQCPHLCGNHVHQQIHHS